MREQRTEMLRSVTESHADVIERDERLLLTRR